MANYPDGLAIENKQAFDGVLASDSEAPIVIINLLQFNERALYEPDRPEASLHWSGRQAYQHYLAASRSILAEREATTLLLASELQYAVGKGEWDAIWINLYPNAGAIAETVADPRLANLLYHRTAAVKCQHNILAKASEHLL